VATLLLAGCLPAAAQNLLLPARTTLTTVPAFSASLRFPPLAVSPSDSSILADYPGQSLASAAQSLTESVATPFLDQRRVSFASLAGGHFELKCLEALEPMENICWVSRLLAAQRPWAWSLRHNTPAYGFRYRDRATGSPSPSTLTVTRAAITPPGSGAASVGSWAAVPALRTEHQHLSHLWLPSGSLIAVNPYLDTCVPRVKLP
jgi:hypothetical protein